MIGGDQQLTPNSAMDESLFLDGTSDHFSNEEPSMVCFTGGGKDDSNCEGNKDADMKEGEHFYRNMYIRLN